MSLDDKVSQEDLNFHKMVKAGTLNAFRRKKPHSYIHMVAKYGQEEWSVSPRGTFWAGIHTMLREYKNNKFTNLYYPMLAGARAAFTYIAENYVEPYKDPYEKK